MESTRAPARLVLPGRVIVRELEARGWLQKDLAAIMGRPEQAISEIINDKKQISPETARELAAAFDTSAEFWMNLESNYRLHLAERQEREDEIRRSAALHAKLPYSELVRRGWLPERETLDEQEQDACRFLGIASIEEEPALAMAAHHSAHGAPEQADEVAWGRRVVQIISEQYIGPYSADGLTSLMPELLGHSLIPDDAREVPGLLLQAGIHFAVVPHLPRTYLDGVALWHEDCPVVALTLHYDRLDHFWFVLAHELAHIALGHQGARFDRLDQCDNIDDEESEANRLAEDWLLERTAYERFRELTHVSAGAVCQFAASQRRHPSIVAGRLRHDGVIRHSQLIRLNAHVKLYLDGWIDAAAGS